MFVHKSFDQYQRIVFLKAYFVLQILEKFYGTMNKFNLFFYKCKPKYILRTLIYLYLKFAEMIISPFYCYRKKLQYDNTPKKILLSNMAHLGDVINATSVLEVLKKAFPDTKIGFIAGSHCKELLENHPLIDELYYLDHFLLSRKGSFYKKLINFFKTYSDSCKKIKKFNYDLYIDLYFYIGKSQLLPVFAKIPNRIGYDLRIGKNKSCGGIFLTHRKKFLYKKQHVTNYYIDLLKFLPIHEDLLDHLSPKLAPVNDANNSIHHDAELINYPYILFHPGCGATYKQWSKENWIQLANLLGNYNINIIITGKGEQEREFAHDLAGKCKNAHNFVDKFNLDKFRFIVSKSIALVGVDSQAGHIASELNKLSFLIYTGILDLSEWAPKNCNTHIFVNKTSCAPCYLGNGCKTMACIRNISAIEIFVKMQEVLDLDNRFEKMGK
jgi:ADP-heptose:LPS heptosyltransferase